MMFIKVKSGGSAMVNISVARTLPFIWRLPVEQLTSGCALERTAALLQLVIRSRLVSSHTVQWLPCKI